MQRRIYAQISKIFATYGGTLAFGGRQGYMKKRMVSTAKAVVD